MGFKNLIDMHVHSDNSFDGNDNVMLLCEKACELGVRAIAFTDHCDVDTLNCNFRKLNMPAFFEVTKARTAFVGNLVVISGIELGQPVYDKALSEEIIGAFDYDFILASVHNLREMEDFFFLDYNKYDVDELLTKYFSAVLEVAQWNQFDSLAHLTYPLRYIVGESHIDVDMHRYKEDIMAIYETLIKNEKALEVNTSGLRQHYGQCLPNRELLQLYYDMGGRMITFGSDAHYAADITKGIQEGYQMAYDCGFRQYTLFERRSPVQIAIE